MFGQLKEDKALLQKNGTLQFKNISYANPLETFSKLIDDYQYLYFLESVEGPQKLSEFSFIGFNPKQLISIKNGKTEIRSKDDISTIPSNDPLEEIKKVVNDIYIPHNNFRLVGGAVGYISYDTIRYWENIPDSTVDTLNLPDIEMGIYDDGIVFDHIRKKAYYYSIGENRYKELENSLQKPLNNNTEIEFSTPKANINKEYFEESVRQAKQYIFDGDIFQTVLSKKFEFILKGNLISFYNYLRVMNPSPYMYFLKYGERQIIGSSPEMLVRVEKGLIETYPIAGTRPRVDDPKENSRYAKDLISDPKERAEHIMLVDLARNDVGRVSEYGSVTVPELMTINQYSHVQHIVSRVTGKLSPDNDCFDALRVMLPAGTVSGAPKVRAMEIIEELEPTRRGPYAGAVGYFSYNNTADFAITIRTLVADGENAYIQVGSGIVADSDPEREWFETEHKAEALMKALHQVGEKK